MRHDHNAHCRCPKPPASPVPPRDILDSVRQAIDYSRQHYREMGTGRFAPAAPAVPWDEASPFLPDVLPAVPPAAVAERAYLLTRQAALPAHFSPESETS